VEHRARHQVRFEPSGRKVRVIAGSSLLEAARRAGLPLASACGGEALCGRCGVRVLEGGAALPPEGEPETRARRRNRAPAGERLACRLVVSNDLTVTTSYW
jgi:adenylate cyclase